MLGFDGLCDDDDVVFASSFSTASTTNDYYDEDFQSAEQCDISSSSYQLTCAGKARDESIPDQEEATNSAAGGGEDDVVVVAQSIEAKHGID